MTKKIELVPTTAEQSAEYAVPRLLHHPVYYIRCEALEIFANKQEKSYTWVKPFLVTNNSVGSRTDAMGNVGAATLAHVASSGRRCFL